MMENELLLRENLEIKKFKISEIWDWLDWLEVKMDNINAEVKILAYCRKEENNEKRITSIICNLFLFFDSLQIILIRR